MVYLKQGMRGPLVVALQIMLNRKLPGGVSALKVDGIFGLKTHKAVWAFQKSHSLAPDGVVAQQTWPVLTGPSLVSLNAIDVFDPLLLTSVNKVRAAGGNPILIGGMCNGVQQALEMIRARSTGQGSVVLLRFDGHGHDAQMNVSRGKGHVPPAGSEDYGEGPYVDADKESNAITVTTLEALYPKYAALAPIFVSFGSVAMMGCEVAESEYGVELIRRLAAVWNVPVTAAKQSQQYAFQYIGPTETAYPNGLDLRSWAASQAEAAAGMCA
jgi:peptidoglycan hydrolase-like protein with peptidoglycan-binding domain